ncbi:McrB family protein [Flavobacterium poyangense]|uniref:McrB family protein n=1 Tax=Flavobacterium poyangense TaxID=2204302 RepID=UPI001FB9546E|nr:AAA family ATPase [Flavobacterium sp. JXAS1]
MIKKLNFLTKVLVDEAASIISKNGIPIKRQGKGYAISIGEKEYPFKLIVTEAAKIADIDLTSKDFNSNETNRNDFRKLTGYSVINLGGEMEYFNLKQIAEYKNHVGKIYNSNSLGASCYNDTRLKLQYLGKQLGELFNIDLINNYNEKPNKMARQGKGFVQKEYILTGFLPKKYQKQVGNQIFIKIVFAGFSSKIHFGIDIDVNFSDENNPFNRNRKSLQKESHWEIPVDDNFPTNWEDLIDILSHIFEKQLKIIDTFFSQKAKRMDLNEQVNILRYKKQIILQGPPGTGKTRKAKIIATEMLHLSDVEDLKNNNQFKLIQFHPSYTYEDFVRGIIAKPNEEGEGILYVAENKTLGQFAMLAFKNYIKSSSTIVHNSNDSLFDSFVNEVIIKIDENEKFMISDKVYIYSIESNRFKYKGDNWVTHPNGLNMNFSELKKIINLDLKSRQEINKNENLNSLTRQHATYYQNVIELYKQFSNQKFSERVEPVKEKNYVLIIDEINRANLSSVLGELIYSLEYRGEEVESIYDVDGKNLTLPPNLYIIGTMNTADRSVGHIDYAIRRRFAFVDVLPENLKETQSLEKFDDKLFTEVGKLFDTNLSPEFEKKDVQLGHSYFIDKSEEKDGVSMNIRLEYEIKPILLEYVKDGVLIGDGIKKKIQDLSKIK